MNIKMYSLFFFKEKKPSYYFIVKLWQRDARCAIRQAHFCVYFLNMDALFEIGVFYVLNKPFQISQKNTLICFSFNFKIDIKLNTNYINLSYSIYVHFFGEKCNFQGNFKFGLPNVIEWVWGTSIKNVKISTLMSKRSFFSLVKAELWIEIFLHPVKHLILMLV